MTRTVLIGSGGHAGVILSLARLTDGVEVVGVVTADDSQQPFWGVPILGTDEILPELVGSKVTHFAMGIGSIGDPSIRIRCFEHCVKIGLLPLSLVHPSASVDATAVIGDGSVVLAQSVVAAGATLGVNVIVNNGAVIEHGCSLGAHSHIATGACLGGDVQVGSGAHVGIGAVVRQSVAIGARAIVGAGAVVVDDVPPGITVVGVPARPLARRG